LAIFKDDEKFVNGSLSAPVGNCNCARLCAVRRAGAGDPCGPGPRAGYHPPVGVLQRSSGGAAGRCGRSREHCNQHRSGGDGVAVQTRGAARHHRGSGKRHGPLDRPRRKSSFRYRAWNLLGRPASQSPVAGSNPPLGSL
jgi:hypothetical protein